MISDLRYINNCIECHVERETTFTIDGRCVGCIRHEIEDLV